MAENLPITRYLGMSEAALLRMRNRLQADLEENIVDISSVSTRDLTTSFDLKNATYMKLQAVLYALWKQYSYAQPESTKAKRYYTL